LFQAFSLEVPLCIFCLFYLIWKHEGSIAAVTVYSLQGNEIDGSHFLVNRVAYRNNTSKYFIDERQCHFSDVASLLNSKGVDLDNNRFLILQVRLSVCQTNSMVIAPAPSLTINFVV